MSIVLFSGGRGNKSLLSCIASGQKLTSNKIKVIVNGLDDGASTGEIREIFGDLGHGISDFLKVTLAMSPNLKLQDILEERLAPQNNVRENLLAKKEMYEFLFEEKDFSFLDKYRDINKVKEVIRAHILYFLEYNYKRTGIIPALSDFKIGNIVFSSMLINKQMNFQAALEDFMQLCEVDSDLFEIIQSTEENSYLVGVLKSGSLLPNEAAVVLTRTNDVIDTTYQIPKPLNASAIRNICSMELDEKKIFLESMKVIPETSQRAIASISSANAIVYGAGTPYSSLLPSLELSNMAQTISSSDCPKMLVINLAKETSNTLYATDVVEVLFEYLRKSFDDEDFDKSKLLTHIIIPDDNLAESKKDNLVNMDILDIEKKYPWIKVVKGNIRSESDETKHDGLNLLDCISRVTDDL